MPRASLKLWIHVAVPLFALGAWLGTLAAAMSLPSENGALLRLASNALELVTVVVSIASVILLATSVSGSIGRLTWLARQIEAGHPEVRFGPTYPGGPIGALTRAFDQMAGALEARHVAAEDALTDELTGLPNRRAFFAILEQTVERCEESDFIFDVCFVDVDEFKSINDQFGHSEGDLALRDVAHVLRHRFGESSVIARLGGDEFAVLHDGDERLSTEEVSLDVGLLLSELANIEDRPCSVEVSIGVATYMRGDTADALMQQADRSMYREKRARAESRAIRRRPRTA